MKKLIWLLWLISTCALVGYLGYELAYKKEKPNFLIGQSTHGHYQIELACDACHTTPFGGGEVLQEACISCHENELKTALDSHPKKKFTDPRNADLISVLDTRQCITCHGEHNPDITHPMGLTLPEDYCVQCHADVGEERPTHKGLTFETCASAGCHNYHDNRALYEDFLLKHAQDTTPTQRQVLPTTLARYLEQKRIDWPKEDQNTMLAHPMVKAKTSSNIEHEWLNSAHGKANVGCTSCHTSKEKDGWIDQPNHQQCSTCHEAEVKGFLSGKHGMRLAQELSPMTPGQARQPMQQKAEHTNLGCNSCHNAHSDNRITAAVEACLGCHADDHSLAFQQSPHGKLWHEVETGERTQAEAVSCATCHMPRESFDHYGESFVRVQHNQNATLRPNEKMIRSSCMSCHTLSFSIDALADENLINNNFSTPPGQHIESIDMAVSRDKKHR